MGVYKGEAKCRFGGDSNAVDLTLTAGTILLLVICSQPVALLASSYDAFWGHLWFLTIGDVLIIPAGVSHRSLESSEDFMMVGAYPQGSQVDILQCKSALPTQDAVDRAENVPIPRKDPVYGSSGPLLSKWEPFSLPA